MILHINHVPRSKGAKAGSRPQKSPAELTSLVAGSLMTLVEKDGIDPRLLASLRVHLDWLQYSANFREPLVVRRTIDGLGRPLPLAEIAIDLRQADPDRLVEGLAGALKTIGSADDHNGRVVLGEFHPMRESMIWRFNQLFWERVGEWESASGRGFEAALPGGKSDANDTQAVSDTVTEFYGLLDNLSAHGQLPNEIYCLEIGVGSGEHPRLWLDAFKAMDDQRGSGYYSKLRYIFGDYSLFTLERARVAVGAHAPLVQLVPMDALNPFKALPLLQFKVLYVHLTNVYDNLIFDEMVRRDGRVYLVEARPYFSATSVERIVSDFGITAAELPELVTRLLEAGPEVMGDQSRGVAFWRCIWGALKLEERLRAIDEVDEDHVPPGLMRVHLDDLLEEAPDDIRFHVSRGAAESFANTLPLLHPRGSLQVQDIFVAGMEEYRQGFRGPGKLDGSVVTWVNGALLRAVGRRAGYDVHFTPYKYRPGSRTSILYTTQRA